MWVEIEFCLKIVTELIFFRKNVWFLLFQGAVILLLGTKEEISDAEPIERPKFIEDMNESELASAVLTSKIQTTTQLEN